MRRFLKIMLAAGLAALLATILAFTGGTPESAEASVAPEFIIGVALEDAGGLDQFEADIGRRTDMFLWYQSIEESLDVATLEPIARGGRIVQLAWEPWWFGAPDLVNQPAYRLEAITRGDHDGKIRRWAREMRDFGYPIIIRPMCEMNGDWVSWAGTVNGNTPDDYVPAWRHVHDIFRQEGATNVKFSWSPNRNGSVSNATYTFDTYYPGDAYVDYIGIDGYNWGTLYNTPEWTSWWQSFDEVFGTSYDVFTTRTDKPVLISETACPEVGGDKAAWIADAFAQLPVRFPRVVGLTWFNYNKETDWRVNSSPESLAAFREVVGVISAPPPAPEPPPEPAPDPAPAPEPDPAPVPDVTAPTVQITSPTTGTDIYRQLRLRVSATDDIGVQKVELYIDGRLVRIDDDGRYLFRLNLRKLGNGYHLITVKAYDDADNVAEDQLTLQVLNRRKAVVV